MLNARIPAVTAYKYLVDESGSVKNIRFTKRDAYNYIHEMKTSRIEMGIHIV